MSKEAILHNLLELFRAYGYDGVSISQISDATGLGKSSLYHHFPGGKEQMANEVLQLVRDSVRTAFIEPLTARGTPKFRMNSMLDAVRSFYACGRKNCLIDGLTLGAANELFNQPIAECVREWREALATLFIESGLSAAAAKNQAEDILIEIEGALIISRALNDTAPFERTLKNIGNLLK